MRRLDTNQLCTLLQCIKESKDGFIARSKEQKIPPSQTTHAVLRYNQLACFVLAELEARGVYRGEYHDLLKRDTERLQRQQRGIE